MLWHKVRVPISNNLTPFSTGWAIISFCWLMNVGMKILRINASFILEYWQLKYASPCMKVKPVLPWCRFYRAFFHLLFPLLVETSDKCDDRSILRLRSSSHFTLRFLLVFLRCSIGFVDGCLLLVIIPELWKIQSERHQLTLSSITHLITFNVGRQNSPPSRLPLFINVSTAA